MPQFVAIPCLLALLGIWSPGFSQKWEGNEELQQTILEVPQTTLEVPLATICQGLDRRQVRNLRRLVGSVLEYSSDLEARLILITDHQSRCFLLSCYYSLFLLIFLLLLLLFL